MKFSVYYLLLALFSISSCLGMVRNKIDSTSLNLDKAIYAIRAKEFLRKVNDIKEDKRIQELDTKKLTWYIKERIKWADAILKGQMQDKKKELSSYLNPQSMILLVINDIEANPWARVLYYFPLMATENIAFMFRKKLGCYIQNLQNFEKQYSNQLTQVTKDEFGEKLDNFDCNYEELLLMSSRDLAKAILEILPQSNL